jgi:hypothetical protein
VVTFTSWLSAYGAGNTQLQTLCRQRFRDELKPALEAWIQTRPAIDPQAAPAPFVLPEYRLALNEKAARHAAEAERLFREGRPATSTATTTCSTASCSAACSSSPASPSKLRRRSMRLTLLVLAGMLCLAGLVGLLRLPVA